MRRGKRPKKKQVHPPRPVEPPTHAYRICCQGRRWVERDGERFLVAHGGVGYFLGLYPTRNAARARIMEMVRAAGWEQRGRYAERKFYWAKRVELQSSQHGLATA